MKRVLQIIFFLWSRRWNLTRLTVALVLLAILGVDTAHRTARLALASMTDMDYAAEVRTLREQGRYAEAVVIADAGLSWSDGPGRGETRAVIERERQATVDEQASWYRRFKDAGYGAVTGKGESLEQLLGAIAADLFVVGDIRDLVIQGMTYAGGGDPDELIVALSSLGVILTLAPEIDWAPALLKVARKAGAVTEGLKEFFLRAIKAKRTEALAAACADATKLATHASPAGALRILRFAENEADLAKLAAFAERNGAKGGAALLITGREGSALVRAAEPGVRIADDLVLTAARKGPAGARFLASPTARVLTRPHPLLGLFKGVYKGTIPAAAARIASSIDPYGWWLVPAFFAWTMIELGLLLRAGADKLRVRSVEAPA
ncbi:MAG: hypothetical protein K2Y21_09570 [Phycisphaerales bacterium]|nr:hypothetical protein [Phycisphaerales bacterium]